MNSTICVQTKRGPAGVFFNLVQGSFKKKKSDFSLLVACPYFPFLLVGDSSPSGGKGRKASHFLPFDSWFSEATGGRRGKGNGMT